MSDQAYLSDITREFRRLQQLAERGIEQITDEQFFRTLDSENNSVALLVKHLAGNMRSRWRDFLTTDGEKPDRHRDTEFEITDADDRAALMQRWQHGWDQLFDALTTLEPADLTRSVTIRNEPHTVMQAINRSLTHYASHVGQIVLLAKHYAGARWQTLSIPRGRSEDYNTSPRGYLGQS